MSLPSFYFNLLVSLHLMWIYCSQHIFGYCFIMQYDVCLLIGEFKTSRFMIVGTVRLKSTTLLLVFRLFHPFFVPFSCLLVNYAFCDSVLSPLLPAAGNRCSAISVDVLACALSTCNLSQSIRKGNCTTSGTSLPSLCSGPLCHFVISYSVYVAHPPSPPDTLHYLVIAVI